MLYPTNYSVYDWLTSFNDNENPGVCGIKVCEQMVQKVQSKPHVIYRINIRKKNGFIVYINELVLVFFKMFKGNLCYC